MWVCLCVCFCVCVYTYMCSRFLFSPQVKWLYFIFRKNNVTGTYHIKRNNLELERKKLVFDCLFDLIFCIYAQSHYIYTYICMYLRHTHMRIDMKLRARKKVKRLYRRKSKQLCANILMKTIILYNEYMPMYRGRQTRNLFFVEIPTSFRKYS